NRGAQEDDEKDVRRVRLTGAPRLAMRDHAGADIVVQEQVGVAVRTLYSPVVDGASATGTRPGLRASLCAHGFLLRKRVLRAKPRGFLERRPLNLQRLKTPRSVQ